MVYRHQLPNIIKNPTTNQKCKNNKTQINKNQLFLEKLRHRNQPENYNHEKTNFTLAIGCNFEFCSCSDNLC